MQKSWVVVANRSEAVFYERHKPHVALKEIRKLESEEADDRVQDLVTDSSGMGFGPTGSDHRRMNPEHDARTKAMLDFATEIVDALEKARAENRFNSLDLIVEPRLLGIIREKLSPAARRMLDHQIDKNIVEGEISQIENFLKH